MKSPFTYRQFNGIAIGLPILFFILSLSVGLNDGYFAFRSLRAVTIFTFLILAVLFLKPAGGGWVQLFMCFYGLASILVIWYENAVFGGIGMFCNAFAFWCLIRYLYPRINFKKHSIVFKVGVFVGVIINVWLMVTFLQIIKTYVDDTLVFSAICLSSDSSFSVVVLSFYYNNQSISKATLFFIFFILFLVFSETFRGAGYFGFLPETDSQYMARFLFVVSFSFLFGHLLSRHKREQL